MGNAISCDPFDDNKGAEFVPVIEPPHYPMFQFDADGVPYLREHPSIDAEMQEYLLKEFFGYGWKWMQTHEIEPTGEVRNEGYYSSQSGISPVSYYFPSDTEMVRYFHDYKVGEDAYLANSFDTDSQYGILSFSGKPLVLRPWTFYIRIWAIYPFSGRWYMDCVEPLSISIDEAGEEHIVWGTSHYVRMSDMELKQIQLRYSFDYSQVN